IASTGIPQINLKCFICSLPQSVFTFPLAVAATSGDSQEVFRFPTMGCATGHTCDPAHDGSKRPILQGNLENAIQTSQLAENGGFLIWCSAEARKSHL